MSGECGVQTAMPVATKRNGQRRDRVRWHPGQEPDFYAEAEQVNPFALCPHPPGSHEKVLVLAARYLAGEPLFQVGDCEDHGRPIRDDPVFDPETDAVLAGADEDGADDEIDDEIEWE